uniref:AN1-type domain-containing protein n=1 Tax=Romanomermis culicivorax TaxID=13658 RepID=A0A915K8N6_ROMCU
QRRTSGCLGGSRSLSSRYANYQQQKDYLISADDTSAKESSAGETELDDYAVASGSYTTGGVQHGKNVVSAQGLIALKKYFVCEPHLVVKSSSCSDLDRNNGSVDPEREKLLKSDSDQEYLTTTEYFNVSDPNLFRHELKSIGKIVIKTGFNDNVGSSEENDQNYSEDPASSGAVIYDHLLSARRFKVKKKNTGIRQHCAQKNKHSAVDDSTDDPKRRNPKPYHSFRGTYVFRPAGVCIPMIQRRTRSKSRLMPQQTVPHLFEKTAPSHGNNQFTTTGDETSSDECATQHSIRINDPLLTNKSAKTNVLPKCKFPNFRAASAQKKAWISSGAPPEKGMSPIACTSSLQQHSFLESTDEFTAPSSYTLPRHHKLPQSSHAQQRCNVCSSRLTLGTTFHCRCGKTTCPRHRNAESHACGYDFRRSAATAAAIIACIDATNNSQNMASSSGSQNDHRTHNLGGDEKTHFP